MKSVCEFVLLVTLCLTGSDSFAQRHVSWKFSSNKIGSDLYEVILSAIIEQPWHIYAQDNNEDMGMPTSIEFDESPIIKLVDRPKEIGKLRMTEIDGMQLRYYEDHVDFVQQVKLVNARKVTVKGSINYMACTEATCLPAFSRRFAITIGSDSIISSSLENTSSALPILTVGDLAPSFSASDTSGKIISLKEIVARNKLVLLDLWASWCVPCRTEVGKIRKFYPDYHNKGFEVLAFSVDTKPEAWKKAIVSDHLSWLQISDGKGMESSILKYYGVASLPRNFLLDNKGTIVAMDLNASELTSFLQEHLAGN